MAIKIDEAYFEALADSVIDGEDEDCVQLVNDGLESGVDPLEAVEKGLAKGINQVGVDFGAGVIFLPELAMAADTMKKGAAILDEKIRESGAERMSHGTIVIGTIKGDIHDIGKSVVAAVLQANGYNVVDIGIDVSIDTFIQALEDNNADVLGMSTLLTLPLMTMGEVIERLKEIGMRDKIKVIVGGCPVTQEFADEIGADAVGFDAQDAVVKLDGLMGVNRQAAIATG
ncbi:MAG: cobalamin-binding protein [Rhodobacteraceae bacterium]|nr:cobalamin-binding protein [Paracoccaceae bacterium]